MAYTQTSTYGYITGDTLEAYAVRDYDSVDARYTEAVVMAKVSQAERIVRTLTNTTTSSDGAVSMVLELSVYLWEVQIKSDHPEDNPGEINTSLLNQLFGPIKLVDLVSYSPVGIIPMQGIDR